MLPKSPGIYLYFDKNNQLLYVGKAINLKNRVSSYFNGPLLPKTELMVSQINNLRFLITESETDALLLEAEIIKKLQPKYNSELKDDKSFLRVKIGDSYFGPYPDGGKVRFLLNKLRGYSLNKIKRVLRGDREGLIRDLEKKMKFFARVEKFEQAQKIKLQIEALKTFGVPTHQPWEYQINPNLVSEQNINKVKTLCDLLKIKYKNNFRIEGYDVSHISGTNVVGSMVVFIDGVKNTNDYRRFKIKTDQNNDVLAINEVLTRRFNHPEWPTPDLIITDGPLRSHPKAFVVGLEKKQETIVLANGAKINLPKSNLALQLLMSVRDESHRFAQSYHHLLRRKKMIE